MRASERAVERAVERSSVRSSARERACARSRSRAHTLDTCVEAVCRLLVFAARPSGREVFGVKVDGMDGGIARLHAQRVDNELVRLQGHRDVRLLVRSRARVHEEGQIVFVEPQLREAQRRGGSGRRGHSWRRRRSGFEGFVCLRGQRAPFPGCCRRAVGMMIRGLYLENGNRDQCRHKLFVCASCSLVTARAGHGTTGASFELSRARAGDNAAALSRAASDTAAGELGGRGGGGQVRGAGPQHPGAGRALLPQGRGGERRSGGGARGGAAAGRGAGGGEGRGRRLQAVRRCTKGEHGGHGGAGPLVVAADALRRRRGPGHRCARRTAAAPRALPRGMRHVFPRRPRWSRVPPSPRTP